jgi:hypothetical protein
MWLPQLVVCVLLLIAMGRNPSEYYEFLRWIVCGVFFFLAHHSYEHKKTPWIWICATVAIIYNPLIPFYLERETWLLFNKATIAIAITSAFMLPPRKRTPEA